MALWVIASDGKNKLLTFYLPKKYTSYRPKVTEQNKQQNNQHKVTLFEFIEKHHNVFTVLGVMGGLAALFTRLENAQYLSILSFVIMLILDIQIWFSFPRNENASISITVFEMFFQLYIFAIGYYLLSAYWTVLKPFLFIIVALALYGVFAVSLILTIRKYKFNILIREFSGKGKIKSGIIRGLISGLIIGLPLIPCFYISIFLLGLFGIS